MLLAQCNPIIREMCGHLPTSLVDGQTSRMDVLQQHWTVHVQCLYISWYVTVNKLVLSTSRCASFHSGDPDQVVPLVLYTVSLYTHTSASTGAGRPFFRPRKWHFSLQFYGVHFIGYKFASSQSFRFRLEIYKLSPVESLQSHFVLTMSHWSSGLPVCFLPQGTQVQIPWGVLMWNRDSLLNVY